MPRTSSIDSAISNISNPSAPQKQPGDTKDPSPQEVRNLIATAGSAENLVQHLLRDKSHAAAQNAQLWKLVDKQRALLLGLNKDLERATKERDRYRKKLKELQDKAPPIPTIHMEGHSPQSEGGASVSSNEAVIGREFRSNLNEDHQTPQKQSSQPIHSSPVDSTMMPSPLHLQQSHKFQSLSTQLANPMTTVTESSPLSEKAPKSFQASRKTAPRPLNLSSAKEDLPVAQQFTSGEVIVSDAEEEMRQPVPRGRRKTREEDDREREILALKEQEARSRSKKEKQQNSDTTDTQGQPPHPLSSAALDQMHARFQGQLSPQSITSAGSSAQLSVPLRSPGLPLSPRPIGQALLGATLPMSPRSVGGGSNFPLSPRAPKQALPNPTTPGTHAPAPHTLDAQKKIAPSSGPSPLAKMNSNSSSDQPQIHDSLLSPGDIPSVNRTLVSPTWPDLLLPPNALPSIQVRVASSRLKPSRNSVIGAKPQEELSVFSLSIFERASASELWRIEKLPMSLPTLEQQLRTKCTELPKLPERKLFSGHSPVIVDARRQAIDNYFDELLDTPMDEQAAAFICKYLSSDVLEHHVPPHAQQSADDTQSNSVSTPQSSGIPTKSGYLTKKGKNFGGWKSRYFVLDSPELRYFEAPGGAHLGTIRLLNARIGRQTQTDPPGRPEGEAENQYRHAFLILEPKRKDMNSHLRHVLCAESDEERDEWVETLLHYIDERPAETKPQYGAGVQNPQGKESKASHKGGNAHTHDDTESKPASSPLLGHPYSDTPSPSNASSHTPDPSLHETTSASKSMISGPINGTKISDAGLWGNRSAAPGGSKDRDRGDRGMRNLFHFRKSSSEQLVQHQPQTQHNSAPPKRLDLQARRQGPVRPVFGMQLSEAAMHYSPVDVEVFLPAVVYRCIEYLRVKEAANEEGLFRLSGSNIVIRSLKDRFNSEGDIDLLAEDDDYDVHAVASLFKMYLRELPATILTRELHLEFLKVLELGDKQLKIQAFNGLVHELPSCNFMLLRSLSQYLLEVVQNSERNKMSVKNVGIVFAPTLNIPAPVFSMFLTEFKAIFDAPMQRDSIRSTEIEREAGGTLTPEDIRSPRRQMFTDLPTPAYNQQSFTNNAIHTNPDASGSNGASHPHSHAPPLEHHRDLSGDLGFAPLQPSYESRSYVTHPQEIPAPPRYPPPQPPYGGGIDYSGSTLLMTPENAATVKAKRRESNMLFL